MHTSLAFMLNSQFFLDLYPALLSSRPLACLRYQGDKHGQRTLVSCDFLQ